MDVEIIILSEVSQTERDKHHIVSLFCGIQNVTQIEKETVKINNI